MPRLQQEIIETAKSGFLLIKKPFLGLIYGIQTRNRIRKNGDDSDYEHCNILQPIPSIVTIDPIPNDPRHTCCSFDSDKERPARNNDVHFDIPGCTPHNRDEDGATAVHAEQLVHEDLNRWAVFVEQYNPDLVEVMACEVRHAVFPDHLLMGAVVPSCEVQHDPCPALLPPSEEEAEAHDAVQRVPEAALCVEAWHAPAEAVASVVRP